KLKATKSRRGENSADCAEPLATCGEDKDGSVIEQPLAVTQLHGSSPLRAGLAGAHRRAVLWLHFVRSLRPPQGDSRGAARRLSRVGARVEARNGVRRASA